MFGRSVEILTQGLLKLIHGKALDTQGEKSQKCAIAPVSNSIRDAAQIVKIDVLIMPEHLGGSVPYEG